MKLRKSVSKKIRAIRKEKKMSQKALAERSGYTPQYIFKIEKSPTNLSLDAIERLASALDIDPGELTTLRGKLRVTSGAVRLKFDEAISSLIHIADSIED